MFHEGGSFWFVFNECLDNAAAAAAADDDGDDDGDDDDDDPMSTLNPNPTPDVNLCRYLYCSTSATCLIT